MKKNGRVEVVLIAVAIVLILGLKVLRPGEIQNSKGVPDAVSSTPKVYTSLQTVSASLHPVSSTTLSSTAPLQFEILFENTSADEYKVNASDVQFSYDPSIVQIKDLQCGSVLAMKAVSSAHDGKAEIACFLSVGNQPVRLSAHNKLVLGTIQIEKVAGNSSSSTDLTIIKADIPVAGTATNLAKISGKTIINVQN